MPRSKLDSIPTSLRSRDGWVNLFELKRTIEPHIHQIEPTNQCHYSCIMCPRSEKMTRKVGFMNMSLYHKIIDEVVSYSDLVRAKEIELFHFGESLLHPELDKMVEYASQKDLKITLSVNAPDLTPEKTEKLLKANPYKVIISLDGYDKESYKRIRGNHADYDKAVLNIDSAIFIHKKLGSECELLVRMIQFDINKNYAASFVANWECRGIQTEIRQYFPWNDERMKELGEFEKYPPFMPCPFPWQYLVVQWDGTVVPCCRDYNGDNSLGNVNEISLKEIWNGSALVDFREQHRTGRYGSNDLCTECMSIYYTE